MSINIMTQQQFNEALAVKENVLNIRRKSTEKLVKKQNQLVQSMDLNLRSSKNPSQQCSGCRRIRYGCKQCRLLDIGQQLAQAERMLHDAEEDIRNFRYSIYVYADDDQEEPEEQDDEEIANDGDQNSASNSSSTDPDDANTSYDQIAQRNLADTDDEENEEFEYFDQSDDEEVFDATEDEEESDNESDFSMWMPDDENNEEF